MLQQLQGFDEARQVQLARMVMRAQDYLRECDNFCTSCVNPDPHVVYQHWYERLQHEWVDLVDRMRDAIDLATCVHTDAADYFIED